LTQKVTIITDSIACLTREQVEQYQIEIIPIVFSAGGKTYKDWVDVTPSQAYELFLKDPDSWKTSAPSPADFIQAYHNASQQADNILCITVSVKLSGVYNVAREARELVKGDLPNTTIEIIDSETATAAEGIVALEAARAASAGKSLAEVISVARIMKDRVKCFILLDTIQHVYRSGRIPKIASQAGSMLNIRPIFTVSSTVRFAGAVRNRERGIERILQMMRNKVGQKPVHVAVMHAYAPEEAERLKERVAAAFNCAELWLTEFSPVMGYACGTGTLGFAFYPED